MTAPTWVKEVAHAESIWNTVPKARVGEVDGVECIGVHVVADLGVC